MKLKRLLSISMALLLVASLPVTAFAYEYDIANGDITVTATVTTTGEGDAAVTTQKQEVTQGGTTYTDDAPVITGTSTTNTVTINAEAGATAEVTLDGVNIDVSGDSKAAVSVEGEGNVTIELDNDNTIKSDHDHAGLEKNSTGELTITDGDKDDGSLDATGGWKGAGIGGGYGGSGSNITITGGKIYAKGGGDGDEGYDGAGIGGGYNGTGSNITIGGGTITANGGSSAAGIGGGSGANGSNITIEGGTITANGGSSAAGIGGGSGANGSNIRISGGTVTATSTSNGAGIGGDSDCGEIENISVSGDAQVFVKGGGATENTGAGAAIGETGKYGGHTGGEITPDTSKLSSEGRIYYYAPGANIGTDKPTKIVHGGACTPETDEAVAPTYTSTGLTEGSHCSICGKVLQAQETVPMLERPDDTQSVPLYRVTDKDGKSTSYKAEQKDSVLTVTVDADFAILTGTLSGINTLKARGVEKIVFVTKDATSAFTLADLLEKGSRGETYKLTHDGKSVTFTLGAKDTDVSEILEKA